MTIDQIAERDRDSDRGLIQGYVEKLKSGDLGMLPVIAALVIIWTFFAIKSDIFLGAENLTNMSLQVSWIGIISIGVVWVLLLGEIDLAAGSVAGLAAASMTILNLDHGVPGWLSIVLGIVIGGAVGLFQGFIITIVRVPSFIVTLSGLIGFQGLMLWVLGSRGSRNVTDKLTLDLNNVFFGPVVAWIVIAILLATFVMVGLLGRTRRAQADLKMESIAVFAIRTAIVVGVVLAATAVFTSDRGLPLAFVIFVGLVVIMDLIARRSTFGRHVYAVGGNKEASRRSGIRVERVRLIVFVMSGAFAAFGGIMLASRNLTVTQSTGGGATLLNAIAAAVIGGVSLFGGRGSMYGALFGGLVLGSLANGIAILSLPSSTEYMVTAAVLLAAVIVDALARRGRTPAR
jgi:D-xylose transport system permease protein